MQGNRVVSHGHLESNHLQISVNILLQLHETFQCPWNHCAELGRGIQSGKCEAEGF